MLSDLPLPLFTVSTPFPRLTFAAADAGRRVLVVLTQGRIDRARRGAFDRETRHVIDAMAAQPGLLGYSARREVFGDTVWTVTLWESDRSLKRFLASDVHRRAVRVGGAAVTTMQSWRAELGVDEIPANWGDAVAMLSDDQKME